MVVRPAFGIHYGRSGIGSHAAGAHNMAGSIVRVVRSEIDLGCIQPLKNIRKASYRMGEAFQRIGWRRERDLGARQSQRVGQGFGEFHPVVGVRSYFDRTAQAELPGDTVKQSRLQVRADQSSGW